jgi:hypothetical protein
MWWIFTIFPWWLNLLGAITIFGLIGLIHYL